MTVISLWASIHDLFATAADLFVVAGYSYKALLIECITPCVSGDRDTVNRGPVCDRGPVDRGVSL